MCSMDTTHEAFDISKTRAVTLADYAAGKAGMLGMPAWVHARGSWRRILYLTRDLWIVTGKEPFTESWSCHGGTEIRVAKESIG